jgi:hypothetical protein
LEIAFGKTRINVAWTDGMDPDTLPPVIDCHRFCKPEYGCFRRAVSGASRFYKEGVHRRKIDDDAACLAKMRKKTAGTEEYPAYIDSDLAVPFLQSGLDDRFADLNSCVVYKNVNSAELIDYTSSELLD